MDWSDIYESANEDNNAHIFSSLTPLPSVEWSFEENKVLENAIAVYGLGTKAFYCDLNQTLPGKSIQDIRKKCMALVSDNVVPDPMNNIIHDHDQSAYIINPMPAITIDNNQGVINEIADDLVGVQRTGKEVNHDDELRCQAAPVQRGVKRRGVPWTQLEHQVFLMGLNKFGRGDWRSISRYTILKKSPSQVASHAQKYFRRRTTPTPLERRRSSIHDVQYPPLLVPRMGAYNYFYHPQAIDNTTAMINNMTITAPTFDLNNDAGAVVDSDSAMSMMNMDAMNNYSSSGAESSSSGAESWSYSPFGDSLPN
ncbi:transcription factor MYBS1-like [Impatiens glandulifera]|uniref:transcription factor MYBS1-like n=1 Tax=Impatiens glandulifera TaxID=253017 RepID=UPI001FB19ABA|nr:transcription factor MYBS1-like [Impatiens glandulifera]